MGGTPGYLTLEVAPGMPNMPENVQGHFAISNGWWTGSFSGITAYHMPDPNGTCNTENLWEITLRPDTDVPKYGLHSRVGHALVVVDAVDDCGNCFIAFNWNYWPTEGADPEEAELRCYYGKKDVEMTAFTGKDPPIVLSEAERQRLGIGMTKEQVERIGREKDEKDKAEANGKQKEEEKEETKGWKFQGGRLNRYVFGMNKGAFLYVLYWLPMSTVMLNNANMIYRAHPAAGLAKHKKIESIGKAEEELGT